MDLKKHTEVQITLQAAARHDGSILLAKLPCSEASRAQVTDFLIVLPGNRDRKPSEIHYKNTQEHTGAQENTEENTGIRKGMKKNTGMRQEYRSPQKMQSGIQGMRRVSDFEKRCEPGYFYGPNFHCPKKDAPDLLPMQKMQVFEKRPRKDLIFSPGFYWDAFMERKVLFCENRMVLFGKNGRKLEKNHQKSGKMGQKMAKTADKWQGCGAGFILWPGFLLQPKDASPDGFCGPGFYWDEKMRSRFTFIRKNLIFPGGCQADDFFSAGFHSPKKDARNLLLLRKVQPERSILKKIPKSRTPYKHAENYA